MRCESARLAPTDHAQRDALRCTLDRGKKPQQVHGRPEHPPGKVPRGSCEHDRPAPEHLEDGARLAAFRLREAGKLGDVLRVFGDVRNAQVKKGAPV